MCQTDLTVTAYPYPSSVGAAMRHRIAHMGKAACIDLDGARIEDERTDNAAHVYLATSMLVARVPARADSMDALPVYLVKTIFYMKYPICVDKPAGDGLECRYSR
jgi:hypothetical protein